MTQRPQAVGNARVLTPLLADPPVDFHAEEEGLVLAGIADRDALWNAEDLLQRLAFGLRCGYAYGTSTVRTHLFSQPHHVLTT